MTSLTRRTILASSALAGIGAAVWTGPAFAAPTVGGAGAGTAPPRSVRLLTGDLVRLRDGQIVDVELARPWARTPILRYAVGGDLYVVPADLLPKVRGGELDERLFNVSGLARAGYDDARKADPRRVAAPRRLKAAADTYEVTARLVDRNGADTTALEGWNRAYFMDASTGEIVASPAHGEQATLPAGRYLVIGAILTDERGEDFPSRSLIAQPGFEVTGDAEVLLDARVGNRVNVTVPDRDAITVLGFVSAALPIIDLDGNPQLVDLMFPLDRYDDVYVGSPAGTGHPDFVFIHRQMLQEPELKVTVTAPERFELKADWYDVLTPRVLGTERLVAVHVGSATPKELAGLDLAGRLALWDLPPDDAAEFLPRLRALQEAGARAVLHVGADVPFSEEPGRLPLPLGYAIGSAAGRLAKLELGATVKVTLRGLAGSSYRYDLSFPGRNAIPTAQEHVLRRRDLAHLRVTYASHGAPGIGLTGAAAYFYGFGMGAGGAVAVPRPTVRDEYVTPGEWSLNSTNWNIGGEQSWQVKRAYRAGRHYTLDWHKGILGPAFPPGSDDEYYTVVRQQDTIWSNHLMLTDAQQNPGELWYPMEFDNASTEGSQELYRDGTLVGRVDDNTIAVFTVPPERGRYELRSTLSRRAAWWQTTTDISAAWTFTSEGAEDAVRLPLLTIHAIAPVDETNTAPGNRVLFLPITVHRQDLNGRPAPVRSLSVSYSVDDGKTWQDATVRRTPSSGWQARITKPGKGFLSLRFKAKDTDGNTIEQTVTRAVKLR